MKILLRALIAAALAFGTLSVQLPDVAVAQQSKFKGKGGGPRPAPQVRRRGGGNKAGKIAGGIAAGIAAGIILNEISKSQAAPAYDDRPRYRDGGHLSCRQLRFRCEDGRDWACRRYDERC